MSTNLLKSGEMIKPIVNEHKIKDILKDSYGLNCISCKLLNGYDDINYHIIVDKDFIYNQFIKNINTCGYLLKIINSLDSKDPDYFDGQDQLLLHLRKKNFPCPKLIRNKSGLYFYTDNFPSGQHIVRLLEFIDGTVLYKIQPSNDLFYQVGRFAAKLDENLKDFHHHVYETHETVWMLAAVPKLNRFLFVITDQNRRIIIENIIKKFTQKVSSVCSQLEKGILHGDFNEHNILVDRNSGGNWYIKAVIDFGDTNYSCYLYELAITIAYMIIQGNSIDIGGYVLAGYLSIRKLTDLEFSLLKICVEGRLCQSLVLGAYSYLQDPKNSYILTTAKIGWLLLEELWRMEERDLLDRWKNIAQNYKTLNDGDQDEAI